MNSDSETAAVISEVKVEFHLVNFRLYPYTLAANIDNEFSWRGSDMLVCLAFDSHLNTLRFGKEEFVLSRGKQDPAIQIRKVKTIRVPSSTEKIIFVRLEKNTGSCVGLVPKNKYPVASFLVHTACDVTIRVATILSTQRRCCYWYS